MSNLQGDPTELITRYFAIVTAKDAAALHSLFAPTAVLESGHLRLEGPDAILSYYTSNTFTFDDFLPQPGPLSVEGGRVTVTIDVRLGGAQHRVVDVFETDGRQILSLHISGFEEALDSARGEGD